MVSDALKEVVVVEVVGVVVVFVTNDVGREWPSWSKSKMISASWIGDCKRWAESIRLTWILFFNDESNKILAPVIIQKY